MMTKEELEEEQRTED
uniref:Uncharacterized protein n=3 Tax=Amniota TaxID=32524 RepID=A0A9L0TQV2_HORSE